MTNELKANENKNSEEFGLTNDPRRWEYGPGELLVEAPDGKVYRLGEIPEEFRDRGRRYPNEIVINEDDPVDKVVRQHRDR